MGDHAVKASGPAELHMLHRSGVKSSGAAVEVGWVTTRCRPRIAPRLGIEGSGRRFAPRRPVWGLLAGYLAVGGPRLLLKEWCRPVYGDPLRIQRRIAPRLGIEGSGRRFAPRRPVWGLLAGYWAVELLVSVKESGRRVALHLPVRLLLTGYCLWDVSPPDGGGLVPGADPAPVLPVGGLAS
jgi:hypothetical protein